MNNALAKKVLNKLSLKDLYDEIKNNDKMIFQLGMLFANKQRNLFVNMIRNFIVQAIKSEDQIMINFFKEEIINMDGFDDFSTNAVSKKKITNSIAPIPSVAYDNGCSSGSGGWKPNC